MAFTPGSANFASGNGIKIYFDPKSVNQVISGCWGLGAWAASVAYRYSREVALETYRQIVKNHPRDTRFSVRQIQVSYTPNNDISSRGETYDHDMSQWLICGRTREGWPKFRERNSTDPARQTPYDGPEATQLARVRMLSGERKRGILMPNEKPEYANWSAKKTIHVFSNAPYEKYLNYGSQGRRGLYYWETGVATAASIANQALSSMGFDEGVITDQQTKIDHYREIVNTFSGQKVYR